MEAFVFDDLFEVETLYPHIKKLPKIFCKPFIINKVNNNVDVDVDVDEDIDGVDFYFEVFFDEAMKCHYQVNYYLCDYTAEYLPYVIIKINI